ncbi:hypothetical protein IGB42_02980 [Andreprevotia sp. IGB-42]|uniref:hypothetical protein n=1 Tax=Andreprevotia sp. IGB-42 TaxID=2497473 RepID=UPI00135CD93D|nr:hypothetical protein [Andreprevotia sp. IGB-42]KAF0812688.1 hypothetical protein IGB42_02980 [Andreprevotia sp. IGB-42]
MLPSEPYQRGYLAVMHAAIIHTRHIAGACSLSDSPPERMAQCLQQVADLQDAIHVVAELINQWERCDERALRATYLERYDEKWAATDGFSLVRVLTQALGETTINGRARWISGLLDWRK